MILDEIKSVMPSFVARVERPDRGGEWIGYLEARAAAGERWARRLGLGDAAAGDDAGPSVTLPRVEGDEDDLLGALLFEVEPRLRGGDPRRRHGAGLRRAAELLARPGRRASQPPLSPRTWLRGAALPV